MTFVRRTWMCFGKFRRRFKGGRGKGGEHSPSLRSEIASFLCSRQRLQKAEKGTNGIREVVRWAFCRCCSVPIEIPVNSERISLFLFSIFYCFQSFPSSRPPHSGSFVFLIRYKRRVWSISCRRSLRYVAFEGSKPSVRRRR